MTASDPTWTVDVAVSDHDSLKRGVTEARWLRVRVTASNHVSASLAATQFACTYGIPTDAIIVDWPNDPRVVTETESVVNEYGDALERLNNADT